LSSITADVVAILDALGIPKVVLIGHDWGTHPVYRFAMWYPERLLALATLSIPYYTPLAKYIPFDVIVQHLPFLGYAQYLSEASSSKEIEDNLEGFFSLIYHNRSSSYIRPFAFPGEMRKWLVDKKGSIEWDELWNSHMTVQEQENILNTYRKSGMAGPTNW